ncbi:MAG: hydrogenase expression/formation protein [Methylomonas sp.]|jgi:hydrogenase-1 operon protein HyaF
MTSIVLPIIGQGSQPAEADGAELAYLPMPEEMATYRMPQVTTDLNGADLFPAKAVLRQLQTDLAAFPAASKPQDLTVLDAANRQFIDELLGEGEVSMMCAATPAIRIQESVLAGIWRLQRLDAGKQIISDTLEIGVIPQTVTQLAFNGAAGCIDANWDALPPGIMNAPPLVAELNAKIAHYRPGDEAYSINLSLLPQTEQDLLFLEQRLGKGVIEILSRGYGNCRISATNTRYVWWVRYFNSQDILILNTLEVSSVPNVACASPEDIADSRQRLGEIMKIYS